VLGGTRWRCGGGRCARERGAGGDGWRPQSTDSTPGLDCRVELREPWVPAIWVQPQSPHIRHDPKPQETRHHGHEASDENARMKTQARVCRMLGRTQRVSAPTGLPKAMESAVAREWRDPLPPRGAAGAQPPASLCGVGPGLCTHGWPARAGACGPGRSKRGAYGLLASSASARHMVLSMRNLNPKPKN
jgi:hypothetical protein